MEKTMDVNELVRTIAQEVIQQLQGQQNSDCILVLAEKETISAEKIQELAGANCPVLYCGDSVAGRNVSRYVLPFLSCNDMADLAHGKASGPIMQQVLELLLAGTEVEVLDYGHRRYSETAPGPLFLQYERYVETLIGYGLIPFKHKQPEYIRCWEPLVTEQVVHHVKQQGAPVLQALTGAQVTPLAVEAAKEHNISIKKCL